MWGTKLQPREPPASFQTAPTVWARPLGQGCGEGEMLGAHVVGGQGSRSLPRQPPPAGAAAPTRRRGGAGRPEAVLA